MVGVGTKVVQTWSPSARVARRWTWTPSRRENASVSASQNGGELGGDVLHRAVALAELDAGELAGAGRADRAGGGGEAVRVERLDEGLGAGGGVVARGGEAVGVPLLERGRRGCSANWCTASAPTVSLEEAQRLDGEVVVVADQGAVAALGEDLGPRRAAAPARAGGLARLDAPARRAGRRGGGARRSR